MTSLLTSARPSVRNLTMPNAPVFVRREVAQRDMRDAFRKTTDYAKEHKIQKSIYLYSLDMSTNVERREREREKENKTSGEFNVKESNG